MSGKYNPYKRNQELAKRGGNALPFDFGDLKIEFVKFTKDGDHALDIIPFLIATKNHPHARGKDAAKIGDEIYNLVYWAHKGIGPKKKAVLCVKEMYGQPCPICEEYDLKNQKYGYKDKRTRDLKPKQRVIYNVVDPDDRDEKIKVFETSFALFEDEVLKVAAKRGRKEGREHIPFGDIDEGVTVEFSVEMDTVEGGQPFARYTAISLEYRKEPHSPALIDDAIPLDKYMVVPTYDEARDIYEGVGDQADDNDYPEDDNRAAFETRDAADEPPADRPRRGRDEPADEPPADRPARESRERPAREDRVRDRERPAREDRERPAREDRERPAREAEPEVQDREDRSDRPARRDRSARERQESSHEPPRASAPRGHNTVVDGPTCPVGLRYGVDFNKDDKCLTCALWRDCRRLSRVAAA